LALRTFKMIERNPNLQRLFGKEPEIVTLRYHESLKVWTPDEGVVSKFRVYGREYIRAGEKFWKADLVDALGEMPPENSLGNREAKNIREQVRLVLANTHPLYHIREIPADVVNLDSLY
jgi:hypothetical protein